MIETLGYAVVVAVLTLSLFSPIALFAPMIANMVTLHITRNKDVAKKVEEFFYVEKYVEDEQDSWSGEWQNILFNKFQIPRAIWSGGMIGSIIIAVVLIIIWILNQYVTPAHKTYANATMIEHIDGFAQWTATVAGSIATVVITYGVAVFVLRRAYDWSIKLNKALKELK